MSQAKYRIRYHDGTKHIMLTGLMPMASAKGVLKLYQRTYPGAEIWLDDNY